MEQMNQGVAEPFSVMELRYWTSNKNIMTKQEEFSCLRSFIMTLPKDSYLRPWLDSVSVEVSQMIKSEISVILMHNLKRNEMSALHGVNNKGMRQ
jgi:hypothetical protein